MILNRLPESRMSEVRSLWTDETVVLIGGGHSLTLDQIAVVKASGARSIAINASYLWAPFADICYFADAKFWRWHHDGIDIPALNLTAQHVRGRFASFGGQKCSIKHSSGQIHDPSVHMLANSAGTGNHGLSISLDPASIFTGKHSGYQALNIAILSGASRILLLGYDGSETKDGRSHFHGGHPKPTPKSAYGMYREAFAKGERAIKSAGAEVLNCSPDSAILAFDRSTIEKELAVNY